jgi:hypothetical protein
MALDISSQRVEAGDYVFFNFSTNPVGVMLGENTFPMATGQIRMISKTEWRENSADLKIRVGVRLGEETRMVFSSIWGHHPDRRNYVFLFDGHHASMPAVMRKTHDRAPR